MHQIIRVQLPLRMLSTGNCEMANIHRLDLGVDDNNSSNRADIGHSRKRFVKSDVERHISSRLLDSISGRDVPYAVPEF